MHYSCQRCNTLKGQGLHLNIFSPNYFLDKDDSWEITNPEKIETEMYYVGHLLFSKNLKPDSIDRGNNTIKLFDLNNDQNSGRSSRQYLVECRLRIFNSVYSLIETVFTLLESENYSQSYNRTVEALFLNIIKYTNSDRAYSTMIVHNFGKDIQKLITIYLVKGGKLNIDLLQE